MTRNHARQTAIPRSLEAQSSAGIVLIVAAVVALIVANSAIGLSYDAMWHTGIGPLSLGHRINDGAMAVFLLLVSLEIKREVIVPSARPNLAQRRAKAVAALLKSQGIAPRPAPRARQRFTLSNGTTP